MMGCHLDDLELRRAVRIKPRVSQYSFYLGGDEFHVPGRDPRA
jgi:hypothetical protein